jgi:hypothetical protein
MLFRVILLSLLFYMVSKMFQLLFGSAPQKPERKVQGRPQSPSLDLSKTDVEDIDFKETSNRSEP